MDGKKATKIGQKKMKDNITIEKISFLGLENCFKLSNGTLDLIVTTDIGPRILRFGFVDKENEFKIYENLFGRPCSDQWLNFGGHRLWHAPEHKVRTYFPDNNPVKFEIYDTFIRLIQHPEQTTGIQKEIDIEFVPEHDCVKVSHRLRNINFWSVELAPWAITVLQAGGKAILPLPPRKPHEEELTPTASLSLWSYTNLTDTRFTFGEKYILVEQDSDAEREQKIGLHTPDSWSAYYRNKKIFVKKSQYFENASYPDFNSNVEVYTDKDMLELETLGPKSRIDHNEVTEHVEYWFLVRDVEEPEDESDIYINILPKIRSCKIDIL